MKVVFGGDFYPGYRWESIIIKNPNSIWSNEVKDFINNSDLRIVNLETPLTSSKNPIKKLGPNLKCSPKTIYSLKSGGINLVTLANNHVFDYGKEGFKSTINVLNENKINYIGVGSDITNASNSYYVKDNVVFLNYGNNEWGTATEKDEGYNGYSIIDIHTKIKEFKNKGYFICLILHAGHELYSLPSPQMVKEFRYFVDIGANLIVTHHSHYYSGYEKYNDGFIFYGLGNMLFDSKSNDEKWFNSFLLKLNIINNKIEDIKLLPIKNKISDGCISVLNTAEIEVFNEKLKSYNYIICDDKLLNESWISHVSIMKSSYLVGLKNYIKYYISLVNRIPYFNKVLFRSSVHNRKLMNYFLCESHSEVIRTFLREIK